LQAFVFGGRRWYLQLRRFGGSPFQNIQGSDVIQCKTDLQPFMRGLARIGYDGPAGTEPFDNTLGKRPTEEAMQTAGSAMKRAFALVE